MEIPSEKRPGKILMPGALTSWLAGSSADVRAFSGRTLVITLLRALFFAIGHRHQLNRRQEDPRSYGDNLCEKLVASTLAKSRNSQNLSGKRGRNQKE